MPSIWPKGQKQNLKLSELVFDDELQVRHAGVERWHVEDMIPAAKKRLLPQVQVIHVKAGDKAGRYVIDGWHTCQAAREAGASTVTCNVRPGTWEDAVLEAARANRQHQGLPMRGEDKRRAVLMVRSVEPTWTPSRIAHHLGYVSDKTVAKILGDDRPEVSEGRDGKKYHKRPAKKEEDATAGWRQVPLAEFLECSGPTEAAITRANLKTAGELYDALKKNGLSVKPDVAADLLEELRALDPAVPRPEPVKVVDAPAAKPGTAAPFSWAVYEDAIGRAVREIDRMPKTDADRLDYAAFQRLSNEIAELCRKWQKRRNGK